MKAIIFAGGVGTRLWPLSRKHSPKQFEKIFGDKSTLQLAVARLLPDFSVSDIFIATHNIYADIVRAQLPDIPGQNIILEPEKKDVGPAVALAIAHLLQKSPEEPVVILWSDHMVKKEPAFRRLLKKVEKVVREEKDKIIFIGQKPLFASENLGWIHFGKTKKKVADVNLYAFEGFKYRPDPALAKTYFKSPHYCWNLGYFVSTPKFVYSLFKRFTPEIFDLVEPIRVSMGTDRYKTVLKSQYRKMPTINFDNAVIEQLDTSWAYVAVEDIGWSDLGAWEALKAALEKNPEDNITKGKVLLEGCTDNLIYNYDDNKTVVGIDLSDFLVINTNDILLVTRKKSVSRIKTLVEKLEKSRKVDLI